METPRSAFLSGIKDQSPGIIGNVPFGLITGAAATAAGLDPWLAMGMSIIVFAGAAQLAAIALIAQHAPALIVVLTVTVINLRMLMYSAAIAPYFRHATPGEKWLFSYLLTDHAFALVTTKFKPEDVPAEIGAYYLGAGSAMWIIWQIAVAIGVFAGTLVPAKWSLDFAIPLVFLSLVIPALTTRAHWAAAFAAGTAAAFCAAWPMRLGLIAAAVAGIAAGVVARRALKEPQEDAP
ncbi:MAG: AzlC family ABC transporter permease [Betaproteobacteria bacterium]|nr:AzlC family ABC transporter permease [Betaproteobacteria bacterium]